jgi:hypothetical protein
MVCGDLRSNCRILSATVGGREVSILTCPAPITAGIKTLRNEGQFHRSFREVHALTKILVHSVVSQNLQQ